MSTAAPVRMRTVGFASDLTVQSGPKRRDTVTLTPRHVVDMPEHEVARLRREHPGKIMDLTPGPFHNLFGFRPTYVYTRAHVARCYACAGRPAGCGICGGNGSLVWL